MARKAKASRTITSAEIIATGVANLVKNTLVTALSGAREVGSEVREAAAVAARGSIRAAEQIGDDLGSVAKQAVKGTAQAMAVSKGAVKAANAVGGDVAVAARKAVEGTIEAARETGADVGSLATSAARGAIEAADRIGSAAGRTVRAALSGTIGGTRVIVQEALQRSRPVPPRSPRQRKKRKMA
jgi:hypothetical protein